MTERSTTISHYLTEDEVSARYRGAVSPGTLRNWRASGRGPDYLKIGKAVLYPLERLEAWEDRQMIRRPVGGEGTD